MVKQINTYASTRYFGSYRVCAKSSFKSPYSYIQRDYLLVSVFIYIHTLSMRAVKALTSLCICTDSPEHTLLADVITEISCIYPIMLTFAYLSIFILCVICKFNFLK